MTNEARRKDDARPDDRLHWGEACSICDDTGKAFGKVCVCRQMVPADAPQPDEIVRQLAAAERGMQCYMCGKSFPHQHSPEEIVIFRNGAKYAARSQEYARVNDQGAAQDDANDAGRACTGSGVGANERHEHRAGESDFDRRDGGKDGGSDGVSDSGEVREDVAAPEAPTPDCGACPGDGSICKTECRLRADSPPAATTASASVEDRICDDCGADTSYASHWLNCKYRAPAPSREDSESFADWLKREMPAGTVIGDPAWWAPRILRAALAQQGAAQAGKP